MGLINCSECGKVFVQTGDRTKCDACLIKEEEQFRVVHRYIFQNPNMKMEDMEKISQETGIDKSRILKFLREGRLYIKFSKPKKEEK